MVICEQFWFLIIIFYIGLLSGNDVSAQQKKMSKCLSVPNTSKKVESFVHQCQYEVKDKIIEETINLMRYHHEDFDESNLKESYHSEHSDNLWHDHHLKSNNIPENHGHINYKILSTIKNESNTHYDHYYNYDHSNSNNTPDTKNYHLKPEGNSDDHHFSKYYPDQHVHNNYYNYDHISPQSQSHTNDNTHSNHYHSLPYQPEYPSKSHQNSDPNTYLNYHTKSNTQPDVESYRYYPSKETNTPRPVHHSDSEYHSHTQPTNKFENRHPETEDYTNYHGKPYHQFQYETPSHLPEKETQNYNYIPSKHNSHTESSEEHSGSNHYEHANPSYQSYESSGHLINQIGKETRTRHNPQLDSTLNPYHYPIQHSSDQSDHPPDHFISQASNHKSQSTTEHKYNPSPNYVYPSIYNHHSTIEKTESHHTSNDHTPSCEKKKNPTLYTEVKYIYPEQQQHFDKHLKQDHSARSIASDQFSEYPTPRRKRADNDDHPTALSYEDRRIAGCLMHCVYAKNNAVNHLGWPTLDGLVAFYSEGVNEHGYFMATLRAVDYCLKGASHKYQINRNIAPENGQSCDLSFDVFDCISDKITEYCNL